MRVPVIEEARASTAALPGLREQPQEDTAARSIGAGLVDLSQGVGQAAVTILASQKEARARAQAVNIADAETARERAKTLRFFADGERPDVPGKEDTRGLFRLTGKEAFEAEEARREAYRRDIEKIEAGIRDPEARELFRRRSGADMAATERTIEEHIARQRHAVELGSLEDTKAASRMAIVNLWADPAALAKEQARVEGLIRALSPKPEADVISWKSESSAIFLEANLAQGNHKAVRDFLTAGGEKLLDPDSRKAIVSKLQVREERALVNREASRIAQEAGNEFGVIDRAKAYQARDALAESMEPEAWERLSATLEQRIAMGEHRWDDTRKTHFAAALRGYNDNGEVPDGEEDWLRLNDPLEWRRLSQWMKQDADERRARGDRPERPTREQSDWEARFYLEASSARSHLVTASSDAVFAEWRTRVTGDQFKAMARYIGDMRKQADVAASRPAEVGGVVEDFLLQQGRGASVFGRDNNPAKWTDSQKRFLTYMRQEYAGFMARELEAGRRPSVEAQTSFLKPYFDREIIADTERKKVPVLNIPYGPTSRTRLEGNVARQNAAAAAPGAPPATPAPPRPPAKPLPALPTESWKKGMRSRLPDVTEAELSKLWKQKLAAQKGTP